MVAKFSADGRMIEFPSGVPLFELVWEIGEVPPTRWAVQAALTCGRPSQCYLVVPVTCSVTSSKKRKLRRQKLVDEVTTPPQVHQRYPGRHGGKASSSIQVSSYPSLSDGIRNCVSFQGPFPETQIGGKGSSRWRSERPVGR